MIASLMELSVVLSCYLEESRNPCKQLDAARVRFFWSTNDTLIVVHFQGLLEQDLLESFSQLELHLLPCLSRGEVLLV